MTIKVWTKAELARAIALRLEGHKWADVAAMIHRSESAMWVKLGKLNIRIRVKGADEQAVRENLIRLHEKLVEEAEREADAPPAIAASVEQGAGTKAKTMADTSIEEDIQEARSRVVLAEARESTRKYKELLGERALEDRVVDIFRERVQPFNPPIRPPDPVLVPVTKVGHRPESAVLVVSDVHVGKIVSATQTNGLAEGYSPRIYCERLHYMEEKALEIIGQTPGGCDELIVLVLGDILEGALSHGAERENTLVIADQFQLAVWTLHQFFCALAFRVPKVDVYTVVGNHGRWPGQKRMPTSYRYSNLDHLVYAALQLSLKVHGLNNITLHLNDAARQIVDIKGSRFICQHGDTIRGGDKQFGVPIHGMTRDVNATLQRFAANDDRPADYFVMGDKHKSISLPLARGEYIVNGSMVGSDEFSMSFCPAEPMQLLFGVHPTLRKTWSYPIKVAHAPALPACPYHLPEQIRYLVEPSDAGRMVA
jgi:hypothetical protein